jgi:2-dehydro-3-deoxyphosphogluconate aldolase / (4S)-4-hydroxy-2-oxoglutarate aldolase
MAVEVGEIFVPGSMKARPTEDSVAVDMRQAGKVALLQRLRAARLVPIVRTPVTSQAATVVQWLYDAGFRTFEITMTVPDAIELIRELSSDRALLVGAGTVPDAKTAQACISAGARFVVAPWVDGSLAGPCCEADVLLMLGAATPSEVRAAIAMGADVVKIFPAASAGGPPYIKSLRSVLPRVPLCPTGGVEPEDLAAYFAAGADLVGMGGALVDLRRIEAGDRAAIQAVARRILAAAGVDPG